MLANERMTLYPRLGFIGLGYNVVRSARSSTRIIELSTISPESSRKLHRSALESDVFALDVAISGSTPTAETGALTLFGGGDRQEARLRAAISHSSHAQGFRTRSRCGGQLGLSMPATGMAAAVNAEEAAAGGEEDFSAVIRRMEELAEAEEVLLPAA